MWDSDIGLGSSAEVVNRAGQPVEEVLERGGVGGVEGRNSGSRLQAGPMQVIGVPPSEDDLGAAGVARRAVSRPIPELPPITKTAWPSVGFRSDRCPCYS